MRLRCKTRKHKELTLREDVYEGDYFIASAFVDQVVKAAITKVFLKKIFDSVFEEERRPNNIRKRSALDFEEERDEMQLETKRNS